MRLFDRNGCCTPVGTKCIANIGGKRLLRVLLGGGSYGGDSDCRLHFGLGAAQRVDSMEITWPSGKKQTLNGMPANRVLTIREAK